MRATSLNFSAGIFEKVFDQFICALIDLLFRFFRSGVQGVRRDAAPDELAGLGIYEVNYHEAFGVVARLDFRSPSPTPPARESVAEVLDLHLHLWRARNRR